MVAASTILNLKKKVGHLEKVIDSDEKIHVEVSLNSYEATIHLPGRTVKYIPSKTAVKFHGNDNLVRTVLGCFGSGKSSMCCLDLIFRAIKMPISADGIRRYRVLICRNTYPQLKSTTIKTFLDWFDKLGVPLTGIKHMKYDAPINFGSIFNFRNIDTGEIGKIYFEAIFLSVDRDEDVRKLTSLETSDVWINEIIEMPEIALVYAIGRRGRYPSAIHMKENFKGCVLSDTNPCDVDEWYYRRFEIEKPDDHFILKQPPGLIINEDGKYITNPEADNLKNLNDPDYYVNSSKGQSKEYVKVKLMGEYGAFSDGESVYSSYNDDIHSMDTIAPLKDIPVGIGWDYGLTPAAVFCQLLPTGQLYVFKELYVGTMIIDEFVPNVVVPYINTHLNGFSIISRDDPAGSKTMEVGGLTCRSILDSNGIPTLPAVTNVPSTRIGAVSFFLNRLISGKPSFYVSKEGCPMLRKGFMGKYFLKSIAGKKQPMKNEYSHLHDALQYICMYFAGVKDESSGDGSKRKAYQILGR